MTVERAAAVIVAAGAGRRFGGDKVFAPLGDRPVLAHTVEVFERCAAVAAIVVVLAAENLEHGRALARQRGWAKLAALCAGGLRRQDSVREGIRHLPPCAWTIIHDGVRPFVSEHMIEEGLVTARRVGAAVAAVPVKDTVKAVAADGLVERTPDRSRLWLAQTPQVFRHDLLVAAHADGGEDAPDDAALLERRGVPVAVYPGSYDNLKITTPEDLALAECILRRIRSDACTT